MKKVIGIFLVMMVASAAGWGQETTNQPQDLESLRQAVAELQQRDAEKSKTIAELQQKLDQVGDPDAMARLREDALASGHSHAGHQHHHDHSDHMWNIPVSESSNIGLNLFASAGLVFGGSTANEGHLESLASGGHDPNNDGYDFTGLEVELSGDVDEYFNFNAGAVFNLDAESLETDVELEGAYATSKNWPAGLELRAGYYYTEFGLANDVHNHERIWLDQEILRSRLFGGDGMRSLGARIAWDLPVEEWDSRFIFGMQNARGGSTVASFGGGELTHSHGGHGHDHGHHSFYDEGIAGRPMQEVEIHGIQDFLWSARWVNGFDVVDDVTAQLGFSGAFGPNFAAGDGYTVISGGDFEVKWKPAHPHHEGQQLLWQTELAIRHLHAGDQQVMAPGPDDTAGTADDILVMLGDDDFQDLALYTQALYSFNEQWHAGLRYEYANRLSGDTIEVDGDSGDIEIANDEDAFRSERHRFSPMVVFQPSHNARFRLQYNYDIADFLQEDAHSVWFGMQFAIGKCTHGHDH